jgi:hypothetical protein
LLCSLLRFGCKVLERFMARIGKKDHARILHMVDVEGRKVGEVAAEYGCSPANVYALLGKLRRMVAPRESDRGTPAPTVSRAAQPAALEARQPAQAIVGTDLFAATPGITPEPSRTTPPAHIATPAASADRPPATITELQRKGPIAKGSGIGAALAKPGFGLTLRTADGDENVTPFRSLEDLLSAVKPILRAAARSPDAVWFSIHKIDLSALEFDAA